MKKEDLPTDLRGITRDSKRCRTSVMVHLDWETTIDWLVFGQAQLCAQGERRPGCFRLEARMTEGVTDFEHDSAYALRLPLIGVQLDSLGIRYHSTHLVGWVDPNDENDGDFRVPRSGYNPMKHKGAHRCKYTSCLEADPKGHIIVPEGFYVPPLDPELYEFVRGKRVDIVIGPVYEER